MLFHFHKLHHHYVRRKPFNLVEHCPKNSNVCLLSVEGVAVGCGWQAFVAYVNVGCYYFVGLPIGCVLGFKFDLGAKVINFPVN